MVVLTELYSTLLASLKVSISNSVISPTKSQFYDLRGSWHDLTGITQAFERLFKGLNSPTYRIAATTDLQDTWLKASIYVLIFDSEH